MIDLYTWTTPNGRKASIMLEEVGLEYAVHAIDITKNEQFSEEFLSLNPNNKIPVIVDSDGPEGQPITLFESGAILIYLAEKMDSPLLPKSGAAKYHAHEWLMFQMGGVGPMFGQCHHFLRFAKDDVPYAKKRYGDEVKRLYGVMDKRLAESEYLAGDSYTVADVATYPWVSRCDWQQVDLSHYANVQRWFNAVGAREAVIKGMGVPG